VAPGPYWTPLQVSGEQPPDKLPKFGADSPTGRPGQPAEIAPLYVLLASTESSFTSGDIFGSTGGKPQGSLLIQPDLRRRYPRKAHRSSMAPS
jgi:NAD(P)-dependent dehydrogenase (short-subunit alcohol dehydrogenase family)